MRSKLKSQSGTSILIALVFFFLCVTVGIIVLTAAASNTGQLSHVKDQRQAYLATSSAARLIREEMEGVSFVRTDQEITHGCGEGTERFSPSFQYPTGPLEKTLQEFCRASQWGESSAVSPGKKMITVEAEGLPDVTAAFTAAADLTITVKLHTTGEGVTDHPLTLTLTAGEPKLESVTESYHHNKESGATCYNTTTTTTITWTGEIGKGAAA